MPDEGSRPDSAVRATRGAFSPEAAVQSLAKARNKGRAGAVSAAERDFALQLLEDYAPGDLPQLTLGDFGALALDLWDYCEDHHALHKPAIRLEDARGADGRPLGLDLLQIVQGDRPFLARG